MQTFLLDQEEQGIEQERRGRSVGRQQEGEPEQSLDLMYARLAQEERKQRLKAANEVMLLSNETGPGSRFRLRVLVKHIFLKSL